MWLTSASHTHLPFSAPTRLQSSPHALAAAAAAAILCRLVASTVACIAAALARNMRTRSQLLKEWKVCPSGGAGTGAVTLRSWCVMLKLMLELMLKLALSYYIPPSQPVNCACCASHLGAGGAWQDRAAQQAGRVRAQAAGTLCSAPGECDWSLPWCSNVAVTAAAAAGWQAWVTAWGFGSGRGCSCKLGQAPANGDNSGGLPTHTSALERFFDL